MQQARPKLSILLPAYNAEEYIREAIDGILAQTFRDFELIIADDGSSDKTRGIIDEYQDRRITKIHNEKNVGKTATVNKLFKLSKGDFITIHDADDISLPTRFEKQLSLFENDPDLILCGTSFYTVDEHGHIFEETIMPQAYEEVQRGLPQNSQFHGPTMVMKREVLLTFTELYRPYFKDNYEDTDLAYRVAEKGKSINLKELLYIYRILETSLCRRDVTVRNRNLYSVVSFLAQQRKNNGIDSLMTGHPEEVDAYFDSTTNKYREDPSMIYREAAAYYFYLKLYRKALQTAWKAFMKRPYLHQNFRTYFYVVRHLIFNLFRLEKKTQKHYKELLR